MAGPSDFVFLSPLTEALDFGRLDEALTEVYSGSPVPPYPVAFLEYQLYELHHLRGEVHAARARLAAAAKRCEVMEKSEFAAGEKGRAAYLCALVRAEQVQEGTWWPWEVATRARENLEIARANAPPDRERLYAEARVLGALRPQDGGDLRRALVNFAMLDRMQPASNAAKFWMARAYEQLGNTARADTLLAELRTAGDTHVRHREVGGGGLLSERQAALDGFHYGVTPGLFVAPNDGVGLVLRAFDERAWDFNQSIGITGFVSTRGSFGAFAAYEDRETYPGTNVEASGGWARRREIFTGTENVVERGRAALSAGAELPASVYLKVGWRGETETVAPAGLSARYSGLLAELGWDTRDSKRTPQAGTRVSVNAFFPVKGFLSEYSFERWAVEASHYMKFLSVSVGTVHIARAAPGTALPRLNGDLRLPGVREGRFRDRNIFGASVEARHRVLGNLSLTAFATLGSYSSQWSDLFGKLQGGYGAALLVEHSRYRGQLGRLEAGVFGGDFVVQAVAGLGF